MYPLQFIDDVIMTSSYSTMYEARV